MLSVAQLNRRVGRLLEEGVPTLWVTGEVSNFVRASSGHWYFTLKDERASVRAVMFRGKTTQLDFVPASGDRIDVRARVTLYEPRGDYQLQVESLRRAGQGNLYEQFLAIRARLQEEGLLDASRKRSLPAFARRIGVITSLGAAALQDVLSALTRRAPHVSIVIYPTAVQGRDAATEIMSALAQAQMRNEVDVLLLVRGGGSMEDLWSFNDEALARLIAASRIPLVSGVGHETDFTIADFVADLRAPTPTAAAELVCRPRQDILNEIAGLTDRLSRHQQRMLEHYSLRLDRLTGRLVSPAQKIRADRVRVVHAIRQLDAGVRTGLTYKRNRVALLNQALEHSAPQVAHARNRVATLLTRLDRAADRIISQQQRRFERTHTQFTAINPRAVLGRGYAIVYDEAGRVQRDPAALQDGQTLKVELEKGTQQVRVIPNRS
ncbi:exodeoxyribonuclease VII large subunit [Advenella mimigardefordensis]|uniref:Exodeoxyribonuclease 7 large subunit n=1 Tax=Advenella mimigardefordensis (strain DSM 17166 / LMG 22922 / DPN7) TaxID=1247726 RepID=W0PDX4_ADVMD|nr:exodeoxyribonuclease 7 large subunit [Advenella mimigardefordensis DPN7]